MLPGQTWDYYFAQLPLAVGLQLRNIALVDSRVKILPPGRTAEAKLREILGDHADAWLSAS